MSHTPTDAQRRYLDVIEAYIHEHGYPPTCREITKEVGATSVHGTVEMLQRLAKYGYLALDANVSRGIRLFTYSRSKLGAWPVEMLEAEIERRRSAR